MSYDPSFDGLRDVPRGSMHQRMADLRTRRAPPGEETPLDVVEGGNPPPAPTPAMAEGKPPASAPAPEPAPDMAASPVDGKHPTVESVAAALMEEGKDEALVGAFDPAQANQWKGEGGWYYTYDPGKTGDGSDSSILIQGGPNNVAGMKVGPGHRFYEAIVDEAKTKPVSWGAAYDGAKQAAQQAVVEEAPAPVKPGEPGAPSADILWDEATYSPGKREDLPSDHTEAQARAEETMAARGPSPTAPAPAARESLFDNFTQKLSNTASDLYNTFMGNSDAPEEVSQASPEAPKADAPPQAEGGLQVTRTDDLGIGPIMALAREGTYSGARKALRAKMREANEQGRGELIPRYLDVMEMLDQLSPEEGPAPSEATSEEDDIVNGAVAMLR